MLKRGLGAGRENAPTETSGAVRSTVPAAEAEGPPQGRGGNTKMKRFAGGLFGQGEKESNETGCRRAALADKKNFAKNEANKRAGKEEGENSKISLITKKIRRSFSASPKRTRSKSSENSQREGRMTLRKGLAELVPRITAGGMRLRPRHSSDAAGGDSGKPKLHKPPHGETVPGVEVVVGKQLKPLPFVNGKRSFDDRHNNLVVYCDLYAEDCWDYLFYLQNIDAVRPNFLSGSRITPKMRMTALDWITQVQVNFKVLPETQLTTVSLFDRYIQARRFTVDKKQIQLISVGCAVIASKYEEIYPPDITEYAASCDNTKLEIMRAEIDVLKTVKYQLGHPRIIQFIRRLTEHYDLSVHTLAKSISDIAAYDYNTCHLKASMIAAVSVYIAAALEGIEFPEKLHNLARMSKAEAEKLAPVFANAIIELLKSEKHYSAIYKKMMVQKKLVFSNDHISQLAVLAANAH